MPNLGQPSLPLAEGTRLFHIGPMKTGTTSLQRGLSHRRAELLDRNVCYPGTSFNHRRPVGAFLNLRVIKQNRPGAVGQTHPRRSGDPSVPPRAEWDELIQEVNVDNERTAVISHELASEATTEQVQAFVDELGDAVHIAISLRELRLVLPSFWAQLLKSGLSEPLDEWVLRFLDSDHERPVPERIRRGLDHAGLVERWASVVGPERVTVIVADDKHHEALPQAFEHLLGLPEGFLSSFQKDGFNVNRSLSAAESELLLQLNATCRANSLDWTSYMKLVQSGLVKRLLRVRSPRDDEPRVQLPQWAATQCQELGEANAERIARSGVRVVGELSALHPGSDEVSEHRFEATSMPFDVGVQASAGLLSAAIDRGATFAGSGKDELTQETKASVAADSYTTRQLALALTKRLKYKVRTGKSKPLKLVP